VARCCEIYPAKSLNGASSRIQNGPLHASKTLQYVRGCINHRCINSSYVVRVSNIDPAEWGEWQFFSPSDLLYREVDSVQTRACIFKRLWGPGIDSKE
jgi:hypothetical protein